LNFAEDFAKFESSDSAIIWLLGALPLPLGIGLAYAREKGY